nr:MAG TPA: hypothetical protein [Caudoviricetes sp.]
MFPFAFCTRSLQMHSTSLPTSVILSFKLFILNF